ncbi:MAG: phosphodiester glycosidase family protein [Archangiaceae bacterium]|nr:phosphodiester glycosidase family protein [Archangiaceae bacterium]
MRMLLVAAVAAGSLAHASTDTWSDPFPGVRYLYRETLLPLRVHVAVVDTCAAGVSFRATAPSEGNRTTSSFGQLVGAQLAINGDFFDHDWGMNLGAGVAWPGGDSDHSGNFAVGLNRVELIPDELVLAAPAPWMTEVVSGRWTLISSGVPYYGMDDGGYQCAPGLREPRTAVGVSRDGRYVYLLVAEGRSARSAGITCDEVIDLMTELGAYDAMGLDSGGSSQMWLEGAGLLNRPSDHTASGTPVERVVRNHLAVRASGTGPAPHCGERPARGPLPFVHRAVTPSGAPSRFNPVRPRRRFDTRDATNLGSVQGAPLPGERLGAQSTLEVGGWGALGVPAEATSVLVNLTAVDALAAGFVTAFPSDAPRPLAASLNYPATVAVSAATLSGLGSAQTFSLYTHQPTHLLADLQGYFASGGAGFAPRSPARVYDSRSVAKLAPWAQVSLAVPVGPSTAAVALNVVATGAEADGFLSVYPCDGPFPGTSNVNFAAHQTVANAVITAAPGGSVCALSNVAVDVVVDQFGAWEAGAGADLTAVVPQRLLDTRDGTGGWQGRLFDRQELSLDLHAVPGLSAATAVALSVTVTQPQEDGYLSVFPCDTGSSGTSTLNFERGHEATNLVTVSLGTTGRLCVFAQHRTHVVIDLAGALESRAAAGGAQPLDRAAPDGMGCSSVGPATWLGALVLVLLVKRGLPKLQPRSRR